MGGSERRSCHPQRRTPSRHSPLKRRSRDLLIASDIQRGLLPNPEFAGETFDVAATSMPCHTIGGDFFDYMEQASGMFAFSLADVTGKGPPAALLATAVQSLAAAQAAVTDDPADTLARINRGLLRRSVQPRFVTMFYGLLAADGTLRYSSAGHEPPAHVSRRGVAALEAGGLVLGLFAHAEYEAGSVQLEPGDLVVVCSDGVTEARNPADEEFGRDRFVATLRDAHGVEPQQVLRKLLDAVRHFSASAPQADDITIVVLRYKG
jgi:sigma-B regulation protein RsbU (phosphoserine phosphatase)